MALLKFGPGVKAYGLGYAENEVGQLDDALTLSVYKPDDEGKLVPTNVKAVDFLIEEGLAFQLRPAEKKQFDDWAKTATTNEAFVLS